MNTQASTGMFFNFEEDFVASKIRCIPMIVRYKLDACGIKLKLAEWSAMRISEREALATAPCETDAEKERYRAALLALVLERTGHAATEIPVPWHPVWSRLDEVPYTINEKLNGTGGAVSVSQWQKLTALQRFALVKLSYPGHENKNFPRAMAEFGLTGVSVTQE